tara:strand:+ start:6670 stop:8502 length:1833 start_codon:yes stop_codon:yes gene_type:complete
VNLKDKIQALNNGANFTLIDISVQDLEAKNKYGYANLFTSWHIWQQSAPKGCQLQFVLLLNKPLNRDEFADKLGTQIDGDLVEQLLTQYPLHTSNGFHRLNLGTITLTLIVDTTFAGLAQLKRSQHPLYRSRNQLADHWLLGEREIDAELSELITELSQSGAAPLSLPNTAHITHVDFIEGAYNSPYPAPWHLSDKTDCSDKTALIIGGGLAGCHSARALAERGFQVTIIERHSQLAQESSGNPQGMLYAKLSPRDETLPAFNLASMMYAQRHYAPFWRAKTEVNAGQDCGVLQLAHTEKEKILQQKLRDQFAGSELIEFVDAKRASDIAGVSVDLGGLFFPHAGWLSPAAVCRDLCRHDKITLIATAEVEILEHKQQQWRAYKKSGELIIQAQIAIITTASSAKNLQQTEYLPLKPIRGQVSYLPVTNESLELQTVVCAEGYLSPAVTASRACAAHNGLGASFNLRDSNTELTEKDHQHNLDNLIHHTPKLAQLFGPLNTQQLDGRVAFRCTTPDYMPLVGPVPIKDEFIETYALLRKNAKSSIPKAGPHYKNLYCSVGYGSRGLAYAPLAAEFLAAQICNEPSPLPANYQQTLHPGRFMIRDLTRNKI